MEHKIFRVVDVNVVAPYTLELEFDDAIKRTIDFLPVLKGALLGPLRDISVFNQVHLDPEVQTITWPNGADFDPATLHDWALYEPSIIERAEQWSKVAEEPDEYKGSE